MYHFNVQISIYPTDSLDDAYTKLLDFMESATIDGSWETQEVYRDGEEEPMDPILVNAVCCAVLTMREKQ
jgi:hypothetical protein